MLACHLCVPAPGLFDRPRPPTPQIRHRETGRSRTWFMLVAEQMQIRENIFRTQIEKSRRLVPPTYVDVQDEVGETALMMAMANSNWKLAQLLLDLGADPMPRCQRGWTALHHASNLKTAPDTLVRQLILLGLDEDQSKVDTLETPAP